MDVAYRRLLRSVVRPPRNMDGALLYHGTKFSTSEMRVFGLSPHRLDPNHGRKFACDIPGIWHTISQHYLGIVGSRGL